MPQFIIPKHGTALPMSPSPLPVLNFLFPTVVLTGGGSGIGLAIAKSVALAGASHLFILGRRIDVLSKAAVEIYGLVGDKTNVHTISTDVSDKTQVDAAFAEIRTQLGSKKLDILISNAGYFTGVRPFGTESFSEWQTAFNINVLGVYLATSSFLTLAAEDATIINISTAIVHLAPNNFPGFSSYAATKLAGSKLISYLRAENPGLHVVDVHPGQVSETEMAGRVQGLQHIDDAELAGDFTVWAASPEARFLDGKFVWVNWDVDELIANKEEIGGSALLTLGLEGAATFKY